MLFSTAKKPSIDELRSLVTSNLDMVNDVSCDTGDLGELERREENFMNPAFGVESTDSLPMRSDAYGLKATY
jgi:hypothetical protein